jgi:hypothetical protein
MKRPQGAPGNSSTYIAVFVASLALGFLSYNAARLASLHHFHLHLGAHAKASFASDGARPDRAMPGASQRLAAGLDAAAQRGSGARSAGARRAQRSRRTRQQQRQGLAAATSAAAARAAAVSGRVAAAGCRAGLPSQEQLQQQLQQRGKSSRSPGAHEQ